MGKILLKNILHKDVASDLEISEGVITRICPAGSVQPDGDVEIMDCTGKAVIPGFVNMHTHAAMSMMRGIGEDIAFHEWLDRIWQIEEKIDDEYVYHATKVACLEMIKTGTTTFNVVTDSEYYSVANVHNVEEFKAALKDINTPVIVLAPGEYDVNCVITKKGNTTIKSANPDDKAVIKGVLGLGAYANVSFENLKFDVSEKSLEKTGHQYLDRYERRSIVPVYAAEASFEGCDFVNLYDSRSVVAINYNAFEEIIVS